MLSTDQYPYVMELLSSSEEVLASIAVRRPTHWRVQRSPDGGAATELRLRISQLSANHDHETGSIAIQAYDHETLVHYEGVFWLNGLCTMRVRESR